MEGTIKPVKAAEVLSLALINEGLAMDKKEQVYYTDSINRYILKNKLFKK